MLIDSGDVNSVLDAAVATEMGIAVSPIKGSDGEDVAGYARVHFATAEMHLPYWMFGGTVVHELLEHSPLTMDLHSM